MDKLVTKILDLLIKYTPELTMVPVESTRLSDSDVLSPDTDRPGPLHYSVHGVGLYGWVFTIRCLDGCPFLDPPIKYFYQLHERRVGAFGGKFHYGATTFSFDKHLIFLKF